MGAPRNRRALLQRIRNASDKTGIPLSRLNTTVATTVVAQMMPAGVVKGGVGMQLRLGYARSRLSLDMDAARATDREEFVGALRSNLLSGWGGFTGSVIERDPPKPAAIPADYVMHPYEVKLAYQSGGTWATVPFELGHDELGDTTDTVYRIADDIRELFAQVGLDDPQPAPVLSVHHQVAQKLHACTSPGSERAHDLVDLQLLLRSERIDLGKTAETCRRLFRLRRAHDWPPELKPGSGWPALYQQAAGDVDVLPTLDEAIGWADNLINMIDGTE